MNPDVLCMQELKVPDADFPFDAFRALGYSAAVHGQRTYNGVAILAKAPLEDVRIGLGDGLPEDQARVIAATVAGIRVISAYIPNGQVVGSDKWTYKLEWLSRLKTMLARDYSPTMPLILCGDFNVAPDDRDVANPQAWADSVLCHEAGRHALRELIQWGLVDGVRIHHAGPGPYSWWDYRQLAFPKGDGLRIDHMFLTAILAMRCTAASVDREERKGKLPSDHAPVVLELGE